MTDRLLSFSAEDLSRFARAAGDLNPLHLDPAFARQTAFGACIVHGALLAIAMLGTIPDEELAHVAAARFWFAGAVFPDSAVTVTAARSDRRREAWELRLSGRGKLLARGLADPDADAFSRVLRDPPREDAPTACGAVPRAMRSTPAEPDLTALTAGEAIAGGYRTTPELGQLAGDLGAGSLHPALLDGLAWASYVVGMELPGRHGLFSAVTLTAAGGPTRGAGAAAGHTVTVRQYDPRSAQVLVDGALRDEAGDVRCLGAIDAFVLPPAPGPDPRALGLSDGSAPSRAPAREQSAVVIGGSRGLGACLALALLAHGYEVHGAYSSTSGAAAELERLAARSGAMLRMHRLDAGDPAAVASLAADVRHPVHGLVLSAAPPPVAMGLTGGSGGQLADYVAHSLRLAAVPLGALLSAIDVSAGWIVVCSSSAVSAPPRDWPHYVAAKAALEGLARWVAATVPGLRTVVVRPPALQTALANTPTGRLVAVRPEPVAVALAQRLATGELAPGLTVLDPEELVP
ncbi:MAG: SDR family NAD(P)-dependent oxidoreductase [Actinobacteria bacterium]|nr:SDR family NAD(P)-dependent oxidoreductase [Actinomycetota bacterium]